MLLWNWYSCMCFYSYTVTEGIDKIIWGSHKEASERSICIQRRGKQSGGEYGRGIINKECWNWGTCQLCWCTEEASCFSWRKFGITAGHLTYWTDACYHPVSLFPQKQSVSIYFMCKPKSDTRHLNLKGKKLKRKGRKIWHFSLVASSFYHNLSIIRIELMLLSPQKFWDFLIELPEFFSDVLYILRLLGIHGPPCFNQTSCGHWFSILITIIIFFMILNLF